VKQNGICCLSKKEQLKLILACTDEILVKGCAKACHEMLVTRRKALYQLIINWVVYCYDDHILF
jgi:hypothetical protein